MSNFFQSIKLATLSFGILAFSATAYSEPTHQLQTCLTVESNGVEVPLTKVGKAPPPKSFYHLYAAVNPKDQVLVAAFDKKGQLLTDVPPQILQVRDQSEQIRFNLNAQDRRKRVRLFVVAFPAESSQANEVVKLMRSQQNPKSNLLYQRLLKWNETSVSHSGAIVEEVGAAASSSGHTTNPSLEENVAGKLERSSNSSPKGFPASAAGRGAPLPTFAWRKYARSFGYTANQPRTVVFEIKR